MLLYGQYVQHDELCIMSMTVIVMFALQCCTLSGSYPEDDLMKKKERKEILLTGLVLHTKDIQWMVNSE